MMRGWVIAIAIFIALLNGSRALGQSSDATALFEAANAKYAEADALMGDDPSGARALYLESAAMYGSLIEEHGIDNFMLHVNRGNALLRAGDVGRAVAAYRRAERLRPSDERVRAGLATARSRSMTEISPGAAQRAADALLWWRGFAPRNAMWAIGVGAYLLIWALAIARLGAPRRSLTRGALASAGVAVVCLGSLALEDAIVFDSQSAVVVADEVIGRNGPDAVAYEATFSAPMHAGVEARVLETRDEWLHVRLADGRTTWLPASAVELL